MKRYIPIILILFSVTSVYSQTKIDSLFRVWNDESLADSSRLQAIDQIHQHHYKTNSDSALYFAELQLDFAENSGEKMYSANALTRIGNVHYVQKRNTLALEFYKRSLTIYKSLGNSKRMAARLADIGKSHWRIGSRDRALESYEASLILYSEIEDENKEADILERIGHIHGKEGRQEQALEFFERSYSLYEKLNNKKRMAFVQSMTAWVHNRKGDSMLAIEYYQRSIALAKEVNDLRIVAASTRMIALCYGDMGQNSMALPYLERALVIAKEIEYDRGIGLCYNSFGLIYGQLDNIEKQLENFNKAVEIYKQIGNTGDQAYTLSYMASAHHSLGDEKLAKEYIERSLKYALEVNDKRLTGLTLNTMGEIYRDIGESDKAMEHFQRSIVVSRVAGDVMDLSLVLTNAGQLFLKQKNIELGLRHCQEGYDIAMECASLKQQELACECLLQGYKAQGQFQKSLIYSEKKEVLRDSLKYQELAKNLQLIEFDKQLLADSLRQEEVKLKTELAHQQIITKKENSRNLFIVAGLLLFLLAIGLYSRIRYIRKARNLIQQKNKLLNQQTEKLLELDQAKTLLYTNITHEFRTPITVIKGMTNSVLSNIESGDVKNAQKSLELIDRNGTKLLLLVNEMLDLAKLESGNMEVDLQQSDIVPYVKYLCESFNSLARQKNINLTIYTEVEHLEMDFDTKKVASIISNLISNAIKYTPEYGNIIVHLNKDEGHDQAWFSMKFKDTGIGLSEEDKLNVFDKFYQVNDSSTRPGEGTGIGLALVKEMAEIMNGSVKVESTLGKGSTFIVQLPITNTSEKVQEEIHLSNNGSTEIIAKTSTKYEEIVENSDLPLALLMEDNEDVAFYIKDCLKGKYQTIYAKNGKLGVDMAYENIPDIIISDVMMPVLDGFEACSVLKQDERTSHIPIILLTAKASADDKISGLTHGADAYLIKPFEKKELLLRMSKLMEIRKTLQAKYSGSESSEIKAQVKQNSFVGRFYKIIEENILDDDFSIEDLSENLHLSRSQIHRKIKGLTGMSTSLYIRHIRLQKAKELLTTTDLNISEIAYQTGFKTPIYFSQVFKESFGISPSEARKNFQ